MSETARRESPFLDTARAAAFLGMAPTTLEIWRSRGGGPVYYKIGHRCFYRYEDLEAFAEARRRRSTADPGPAAGAIAGRSPRRSRRG